MDKSKSIASGIFETQEFFTVEQIASVLEMTPRAIRNLINSKKLRAGKFGGEWRIHRDDLRNFIESQYRGKAGINKMKHEVSPLKENFPIQLLLMLQYPHNSQPLSSNQSIPSRCRVYSITCPKLWFPQH